MLKELKAKSKKDLTNLAKEYIEKTRQWVKSNPEKSLLVGFGLGILFIFAFKFLICTLIVIAFVALFIYFNASENSDTIVNQTVVVEPTLDKKETTKKDIIVEESDK